MKLDDYVMDRQRALDRWSQRIEELLCLVRDLPGGDSDLRLDLQGLQDKRDEAANRIQQLALAQPEAWRTRQRELEDSWLRMVRAWNTVFRKLEAARQPGSAVEHRNPCTLDSDRRSTASGTPSRRSHAQPRKKP